MAPSVGGGKGKASTTSTSTTHPPPSASSNVGQHSPAGSKRRRASGSGSGSRGVANLSQEQLAKKRANDREAQRAIRERTKNQIETLERRIEELTSRQPYQELQEVIRQKEIVEAENADIKRRLLAVLNIVQPLLADGHGLTDVDSPAFDARGSFPRSSVSGNSQSAPYSPSTSTVNSQPSTRIFSPVATLNPHHVSGPHNGSIAQNLADKSARGRGAEGVGTTLRTTSVERPPLGILPDVRPDMQGGEPSSEAKRPSALPADSHITLSSPTNDPSPHEPQAHLNRQVLPLPPLQLQLQLPNYAGFSTLPANTGPSCLLDGLLLDFIADRRRLASNGATELELVGPVYPDFSGFLIPDRRASLHTLSRVLTDILGAFPDIAAPPELTATFYGMYLTMRWHVCPTLENYERLPDWLRPTSWQILTPHPIWIDHLPWPEMREELVRGHARYPFENFFIPFTKTLSLNWPYDHVEVFSPTGSAVPGIGGAADGAVGSGGAGGEIYLNPLFEAHLRDLSNWSVGTRFAQAFPLLAGSSVRIEDKEDSEAPNGAV